jgi:hypothetical protein
VKWRDGKLSSGRRTINSSLFENNNLRKNIEK